MRPPGRSPLPDLGPLLDETNRLLAAKGLPICHSVTPVPDGDTANPNVIAEARDCRYVVKVTERHPDTLDHQLEVANALRDRTNLPIPHHLCCAQVGDPLPLMVMEWLPGEQLRVVLAPAEGNNLHRVCASLGACLAGFHDPEHLDLVPPLETSSSDWLYARTVDRLRETGNAPRAGGVSEIDAAAVRCYLDERIGEMTVPAIPALEKADQDLRDFLADPSTYEITGMLDWERVSGGDGVFAVTLIFFRLWLNGQLDGWTHFLTTYNRLASVPAKTCPQAELYLMCRAVLASRANEGAKELVDLLLQGQRLPFEEHRPV